MSEYSMRTEIVWPDVPPLPPERERELGEWLEAAIKREFDRLCAVPLPALPIEAPACKCGKYRVLHHPKCPYWAMVT